MADAERTFSYVAIDSAGKRVKGMLTARDDGSAFERLKRDGLSPLSLRSRTPASVKVGASDKRSKGLTEREAAEFLSDLAALLKAGADIRSALNITGGRSDRPSVRVTSRALTSAISGGDALDQAFTRSLGKDHVFVGALVAAGEATGDLAGGLQRAADMLQSRLRLRDQLVSTLSYPAFVLLSTIVAVGVILFFVVPSLAPLVSEAGSRPPLSLSLMIGASTALRQNAVALVALTVAAAIAGGVAGAMDLLTGPLERLMLDGPARRTASGLVFGGFAIALGNMLSAGAPMSEALRLAVRSVRSATARARLEPVSQAVRNGQPLSNALEKVNPFPTSIIRLVVVGEASGALGTMLARAGQMEEDAAIRRIEAAGRILGPALIVLLGGMIGLMMAGLLSGVSQLGDAALQ